MRETWNTSTLFEAGAYDAVGGMEGVHVDVGRVCVEVDELVVD